MELKLDQHSPTPLYKQIEEQVRELTQRWEFLALELEELKRTSFISTAKDQEPRD